MSGPRHLWSGDWELDSTAAREELARRRAENDEPPETPPAPSVPAGPSAAARARAFLRALRADFSKAVGWQKGDLRIALFVALLTLVTAGTAFGLTLLAESGGNSSANTTARPPWLGLNVVGSPLGVMVANVAPGGPAAHAGIQPGDTITGIGNQPVNTVDDVGSDLGGLHAGSQVQVHFTRGLVSYTTVAKLAAPHAGSP